MNLIGRNLYIADKKAQSAAKIEVNGTSVLVKDENDVVLNKGKVDLNNEIYACLFCNQLNTIVFIVNCENAYSTSLVMAEQMQFEELLRSLRQACPRLEISEQNTKINAYAMSIVAKLQEGVAIKILETKEEKAIKCCPECGMQCDPNIPYCMECGASV